MAKSIDIYFIADAKLAINKHTMNAMTADANAIFAHRLKIVAFDFSGKMQSNTKAFRIDTIGSILMNILLSEKRIKNCQCT